MRPMMLYGRKPFVKTRTLHGTHPLYFVVILWLIISSCVPALAIGFDDLQKRVEAQRAQSTSHQEKLKVGKNMDLIIPQSILTSSSGVEITHYNAFRIPFQL